MKIQLKPFTVPNFVLQAMNPSGRAEEMEDAYKLSVEKDKSHFLSRFGSEANPAVSDWLRHWWRSIGGKIHGPRIETAYIPEAHLLREVTALRNEH